MPKKGKVRFLVAACCHFFSCNGCANGHLDFKPCSAPLRLYSVYPKDLTPPPPPAHSGTRLNSTLTTSSAAVPAYPPFIISLLQGKKKAPAFYTAPEDTEPFGFRVSAAVL